MKKKDTPKFQQDVAKRAIEIINNQLKVRPY